MSLCPATPTKVVSTNCTPVSLSHTETSPFPSTSSRSSSESASISTVTRSRSSTLMRGSPPVVAAQSPLASRTTRSMGGFEPIPGNGSDAMGEAGPRMMSSRPSPSTSSSTTWPQGRHTGIVSGNSARTMEPSPTFRQTEPDASRRSGNRLTGLLTSTLGASSRRSICRWRTGRRAPLGPDWNTPPPAMPATSRSSSPSPSTSARAWVARSIRASAAKIVG